MSSPALSDSELPLPAFFDSKRAGEIWPVPYQQRAMEARQWERNFKIQPTVKDQTKIALIGIDIQNTFCIPGYELFVGGRNGLGAVEDNQRLCTFLYRNLHRITHIIATLDSHQAMQIFHPIFLVDPHGEHPTPMSLISLEDIISGRWRFNPSIAVSLSITPEYGQRHLVHYVQSLKENQKYDLTIWPYHGLIGSTGHALVSLFEEAVFFHTITRNHQDQITIKGDNPFTEHYSMIGPEVLSGPDGEQIASKSSSYLQLLHDFDLVVIAGQAKSHCVAWTIDDLLTDILVKNPELVKKVYLLEDCTSPVVVPGVVDYTEQADAAFDRFAAAGMHIVRSDQPINQWPR